MFNNRKHLRNTTLWKTLPQPQRRGLFFVVPNPGLGQQKKNPTSIAVMSRFRQFILFCRFFTNTMCQANGK